MIVGVLKSFFGYGQEYNDNHPISIIDYENVLNAGFKEVELIPIHKREYFKNKSLFIEFLQKVPILESFSKDSINLKKSFDEKILDKYIEANTFNGKIRLLRRYYGIIAKK